MFDCHCTMRASSSPPVSFRLSVAAALLSAATLAACSAGMPYRPPETDAARTAPDSLTHLRAHENKAKK
ncbi:hypothetical protein, partial [Burkholderia sp. LMG 13014]|uniref:hypothetical protein n=1 Tax=Burkholderia sp. LMG 13014 TaxID=2709306 RepID=UPI001964A07C